MTGIHPNRISKIKNPKKFTVTADEFYLIALASEADLDEMAAYVFQEFKLEEKIKGLNSNEYDTISKFGQFINDGLIFQKTVSKRTNIKESKLSTIINDQTSSPLAKDVYLAALAIREKPSEGFFHISGHLQINSEDKQQELKELHENELANVKQKKNRG